ncbi:polyamine ABC transporter substrate-binding protein [Ignatzschineria larvae DSM 13226]|uniref:Putrescine-binding periplasmic protein n=1 Tax=Ignatzschineria larvae DSM 13226 TaxID=1111732 RepID=A0ABZ3C499_9GAMM|nr:polyamine ABC transporter substrate-binding protein [Ignatzschineria larvae]
MKKFKLATLLSLGLALGTTAVQAQEVRVYNWTDYIDPELITEFTDQTGIKVIYDTFDSNEVLLAKTLTGNSGYDIVVPSDYTLIYMTQADAVQKIDRSKLQNIGNIWPFVEERLEELPGATEYSVPYMWGTTGIAYNVDKIQELVPDAPLDSMELLFNPEYASKLASCGIYVIDSPSEFYPMLMRYLGLDPESTSDADLAKANEVLEGIRPYITKFHSSEYINAMANGDACLSLGWSGDLYLAKARAKEANAGVNIEYFIPKEGGLLWFDQLAILKNAKNVDEAYAFIDFLLDAKVNARAADYVEYATSNEAAFPYVNQELLNDKALYPSEETLSLLNVKQPYTQREQKKLMRQWLKIKAQK